ncbi:MAG: aminotransferase class III-fold pyridoxal phosphate-dependent enzyme [Acidiferrobacterales bacterium]
MSTFRDRVLAVFPAGSNGELNLPPELAMVITNGRGCELWDSAGRRFMDFSIGWGSVLVGHAHPQVVEAVARSGALQITHGHVPLISSSSFDLKLSQEQTQPYVC